MKLTINGVKTQNYNHGTKGIAFDCTGLTPKQVQKLLQGLNELYNEIKPEISLNIEGTQVYGYLLAK